MTCGACEPGSFRSKPGSRVLGYLTAANLHTATIQARKLYYMGAEVVLSDAPETDLNDRPGWKRLSDPACLRGGDRLILSKEEDLDGNSQAAELHIAALMGRGVEVFILKPEFFENDYHQVRELVE